MTVSFVGAASAEATSLTLPTHQAGDLLVMWVLRSANDAPVIPSPWLHHQTRTSGTGGNRGVGIAWRVAQSSAETSGTWTNAFLLACSVYRHTTQILSLGFASNSFGTGTANVTYPGLATRGSNTNTTKLQDASSWLIGFCSLVENTSNGTTAPTGMTNRTALNGSTGYAVAIHDTAANVASWNATNFVANQNVTHGNFTAEIIATGGLKSAGGGMLVHPGMSGGMRG